MLVDTAVPLLRRGRAPTYRLKPGSAAFYGDRSWISSWVLTSIWQNVPELQFSSSTGRAVAAMASFCLLGLEKKNPTQIR